MEQNEVIPAQESGNAEVNTDIASCANGEELLMLIIDDDKWIHRVLEKYLRAFGFRTISAYDPYEGVSMSVKYSPDLIFLDIVLPEIRGELILKLLKTLDTTTEIPIIIMSGNLDKEVLGSTYRAGAAGYIAKPLSRKTLAKKLKQTLGPVFDSYLKNADEAFIKDLSLDNADSILII